MRRWLPFSVLIGILVLPPIPFLWFGWSHIGSPQGFAAILAVVFSYGGWLAALAAFVQITGIPWREWFESPKPQPSASQAPPTPPPVYAPLSALRSIPSPPADFTGRANELAQLVADLSPVPSPDREGVRGGVISGLTGMGGIGKTALALVVARKLAAQFSDAQIFVDMRGTAATPTTPTDAMRQIIHAFEPTADLRQATDAEIAALYCSLLDGKRALLLLDNAANAAQVKPLVPPPTCALLVTSRRHFTLPGLQPLRLDVMGETDARDLLLKIAPRLTPSPQWGEGRGEGIADDIARLCGYLPLALRIAGSTLATRVDLSPAEYIARLRQRKLATLKSDDEDVEAVFGYSYDLLSSDMQARWRALAVFPAPFDAPAAAAVWAMDADAARDALSEFVRLSLLDFIGEGETGRVGERETSLPLSPSPALPISRYSLHDLLRAYADARLRDDERETARLRHAQHYLEVARAAQQLYLQGGDNARAGLARFDAEWLHIQQGQAWATTNRETSEDAARLCSDYPDAAIHCLALRLHRRELVAWLEKAIAAARQLGIKYREGSHLGNLGHAHAELGEVQQAIGYYEQALAIKREIGDRRGEGTNLGGLGFAYYSLGEVQQAVGYYEQALAIEREIGNRRGEGTTLHDLGAAYVTLGKARQAIGYLEQALAIDRESGNKHGEGGTLGALGGAYRSLGEVRQAIRYYEQGLAMVREIGCKRCENNDLNNLGMAYAELGETRNAIGYYERALEITREIEDKRMEGNVLNNLGSAYDALGETRKAIEYYEQALVIAREIGNRRHECRRLNSLGVAYANLGEVGQAVGYFEQALAIAREIGDRRGERSPLGNLGGAYNELDEPRKAIEYCEQSLAIDREIGDRRGEATDLSNLGMAYEKLGDKQQAIAFTQAALEIFVAIESPYAERALENLQRIQSG